MIGYSNYKKLAVACDGKSGIVVVDSEAFGYPVPLKFVGEDGHLMADIAYKKLGWVRDRRCKHGWRKTEAA